MCWNKLAQRITPRGEAKELREELVESKKKDINRISNEITMLNKRFH